MGGPGGIERRRGERFYRQARAYSQLDRDDDGLALVMSEVVQLMGATGGMLTMHAHGGSSVEPIFVEQSIIELGLAGIMQRMCSEVRPIFEDGKYFWRVGGDDRKLSVLMMPVDSVPGHGRLMLSVVFRSLTAEVRHHAESLYRDRRPFAVGYFHLWQANRQLTQRAESLEAALDHAAIGVLLLDQQGRLIFANQTGKDILEQNDGLTQAHGLPCATHLVDGANFQAAINHTLSDVGDTSDSIVVLSFRRKLRPALLAALLCRRHSVYREGDVALTMYIIDPTSEPQMLVPICRLHNMTNVETSLTCLLATGNTLASAATKMRIKEQTARSYLKNIFVKTNTSRQAELIGLLFSSLLPVKNYGHFEVLTSNGGYVSRWSDKSQQSRRD